MNVISNEMLLLWVASRLPMNLGRSQQTLNPHKFFSCILNILQKGKASFMLELSRTSFQIDPIYQDYENLIKFLNLCLF